MVSGEPTGNAMLPTMRRAPAAPCVATRIAWDRGANGIVGASPHADSQPLPGCWPRVYQFGSLVRSGGSEAASCEPEDDDRQEDERPRHEGGDVAGYRAGAWRRTSSTGAKQTAPTASR